MWASTSIASEPLQKSHFANYDDVDVDAKAEVSTPEADRYARGGVVSTSLSRNVYESLNGSQRYAHQTRAQNRATLLICSKRLSSSNKHIHGTFSEEERERTSNIQRRVCLARAGEGTSSNAAKLLICSTCPSNKNKHACGASSEAEQHRTSNTQRRIQLACANGVHFQNVARVLKCCKCQSSSNKHHREAFSEAERRRRINKQRRVCLVCALRGDFRAAEKNATGHGIHDGHFG